MQNDRVTLKDLSIFDEENGIDVFSLLDHTTTRAGREVLVKHVKQPPQTYESLQALQATVKFWSENVDLWPAVISNGTLVMLEKFYESTDWAHHTPGGFNLIFGSFIQKLFNKSEYHFTQFSLSHLSDFLKGCHQLSEILDGDAKVPDHLKKELTAIKEELNHKLVEEVTATDESTPYKEMVRLSYMARRDLKHAVQRLIYHYTRLDAWQAMARATSLHQWSFPILMHELPISFEATGLIHPLLKSPVSYDIHFDASKNFMLLTGANMSGKTTFMRSLGVGALLAHLGCGVPAKSLRISFFSGVVTNMHVEDNILKGESYFFAEVKRIKHTAESLINERPHLVLMDELFKGTNVHDAYECTKAVIEGMQHHPHHLIVLSTHLYEVAEHFSTHPEIIFSHFVTEMGENDHYKFTYELKDGISNDRIGYRILQKEGVLDLLHHKKS